METEEKATEPLLPLSAASGLPANGATTALSNARARLVPCGAKTGAAELASVLALVAPTGMNDAERGTWISSARHELRGIPEDLLKRGCSAARRHADHPAKVLPCIFREVEAEWERRKRVVREIEREASEVPRLPKPDYVTAAEAAKILREAREEFEAKGEQSDD